MFDKVVKSTVPGQVIEQIKELLVKENSNAGSPPPERQLVDMLGVSLSLREALRALEYAGMLETRVGEGIFVADGDTL
ncbi:MAG: FadR/GntR family transcriptional regulator [Bilophila wadsworthia]